MRYDRDALVETLVYHQRRDIESCTCGWAVLGASHSEHVADTYELRATEYAEEEKTVVSIRLSPLHLDRLDEIARRLGVTRTDAVRYMVDRTDLPSEPKKESFSDALKRGFDKGWRR